MLQVGCGFLPRADDQWVVPLLDFDHGKFVDVDLRATDLNLGWQAPQIHEVGLQNVHFGHELKQPGDHRHGRLDRADQFVFNQKSHLRLDCL